MDDGMGSAACTVTAAPSAGWLRLEHDNVRLSVLPVMTAAVTVPRRNFVWPGLQAPGPEGHVVGLAQPPVGPVTRHDDRLLLGVGDMGGAGDHVPGVYCPPPVQRVAQQGRVIQAGGVIAGAQACRRAGDAVWLTPVGPCGPGGLCELPRLGRVLLDPGQQRQRNTGLHSGQHPEHRRTAGARHAQPCTPGPGAGLASGGGAGDPPLPACPEERHDACAAREVRAVGPPADVRGRVGPVAVRAVFGARQGKQGRKRGVVLGNQGLPRLAGDPHPHLVQHVQHGGTCRLLFGLPGDGGGRGDHALALDGADGDRRGGRD